MANQLSRTAELLRRSLVRDHPEWEAFAVADGFSVPFTKAPDHRLEVVLRDADTIEVAYECGGTCGRAEKQFAFSERDREDAVESVCSFVNSLYSGQTVVVVEQLGKIVRTLRRDGITELASFKQAGD